MAIHSYDIRFRHQLDEYCEGLSTNLDLIETLSDEKSDAALSYLLELACQAQNMRNIELGRTALFSLPRTWLLERIERLSEPLLNVDDEWAYRRLMEIYQHLDGHLVQRLSTHGKKSLNPDIRDTAQEYSNPANAPMQYL